MTPVQARMARAAVQLTVEELARKGRVPAAAIVAIESGDGPPDPVALAGLRGTFQALGVSLVGEDGVTFAEGRYGAGTVPLDALNSANDE